MTLDWDDAYILAIVVQCTKAVKLSSYRISGDSRQQARLLYMGYVRRTRWRTKGLRTSHTFRTKLNYIAIAFVADS